jgi:hypothetical protein
VESSSTAGLAGIWADATPLTRFIEERAEQSLQEGTPAYGETNRAAPLSNHQSDLVPRWANLARHAEFVAALRVARDRAQVETIKDLVAGRLVGLGRLSDSYNIENIDASFWIGADVRANTATRADTRMVEVHVVSPDAILSLQPVHQSGPEKPSAVKVRRKRGRSNDQTKVRLKVSPRQNVGGKRKTKPTVIRAFRKLWTENPEFRELPVKSMVPKVRAEILGDELSDEERSGFHSSSMAKTIGHELTVVRNQKIRNKPKKRKIT